jgi:hypothetical protein
MNINANDSQLQINADYVTGFARRAALTKRL